MDGLNLNHALDSLSSGITLSADEMTAVMKVIMGGFATDEQVTVFLTELAKRKPTGEELYGATRVMKQCATRVELPGANRLLDTCGTGGAPKTFNVSTLAGIVCATGGVRVAKHGNRSKTGRGSAEILEALGINIHSSVKDQAACLQAVGICFCFAPNHHKAVKHVMPIRKQLQFPTIFNLLGPLTNPCGAGVQLLGVWDKQYMDVMAEALKLGGVCSGAVVHSQDGLDEISLSDSTWITFVQGDTIEITEISPEQFGFDTVPIEDVTAHSLEEAVDFSCRVLGGEESPISHIVAMNSGVAFYIAGSTNTINEGVKKAFNIIKSGDAKKKLHEWVKASNNKPPKH